MFVVHNELQNFADAAALGATLRLNGEAGGITRAKAEVDAIRSVNSWNLGSLRYRAADVTIRFAASVNGGAPGSWVATPPNPPLNYNYAQVRVTARVPVFFMAVLSGQTSAEVSAAAAAGQLPSSSPQSYFPFTPIAHTRNKPNFGFLKGEEYTLKWPASPHLNGGNPNVCRGDRHQTWVDLSNMRGSENRGYFGDQTSASVMWEQVANDAPVQQFREGDRIILTGGAKSTVKDALDTRIRQDADATAPNFDGYRDRGHTRRIVTVPVTDAAAGNEVVGFARFFLLPANKYSNAGGNEPWCAEYIGPAAPEGSDSQGASPSAGSITKVRLWN
jgi:hypothetical protein